MFLVNTAIMKRTIIIRHFARNIAPVAIVQSSNDKGDIHFHFTSRPYSIEIRSILRSAHANIIAQGRGRPIEERLQDFRFESLFPRHIVDNFLFLMYFRLYYRFYTGLIISELRGRTGMKGGAFTKDQEDRCRALGTKIVMFTAVRTSRVTQRADSRNDRHSR